MIVDSQQISCDLDRLKYEKRLVTPTIRISAVGMPFCIEIPQHWLFLTPRIKSPPLSPYTQNWLLSRFVDNQKVVVLNKSRSLNVSTK